VIATVPDSCFRSGSGSDPNHCQIGGPGHQYTSTINLSTAQWQSHNPSEWGVRGSRLIEVLVLVHFEIYITGFIILYST